MILSVFLLSVVAANISVILFGPISMPINALVLVGLDITLRDRLHDNWHNKHLKLKMFCLIVAGAIITYLFNRSSVNICIASIVAFSAALSVDAIVYGLLINRKKIVKINASNVCASAVDSLLFPTIAFGIFMPGAIVLQFAAKVFGGFVWSKILDKKS